VVTEPDKRRLRAMTVVADLSKMVLSVVMRLLCGGGHTVRLKSLG